MSSGKPKKNRTH